MNIFLLFFAFISTNLVAQQSPASSSLAQIFAPLPAATGAQLKQDRAMFTSKLTASDATELINSIKQLAADYQQILATYKNLYDAAHFNSSPLFGSPMTVYLHQFYNLLMQAIKTRADMLNKNVHKKFDDQIKDINSFLLILDTCDAQASSMATTAYKDAAPDALKYYKMLQGQYLTNFLASFLATIQQRFAHNKQSLNIAQQIYNHGLNYWHEYAEVVGIKASTPLKVKLVTAMARIYVRNAEMQLKTIDFKKNSVAENKKIYTSVVDDYNHARALFQSSGNKQQADKTNHLFMTTQSKSKDYDLVQKIFSDGMQFVSQKTIDAKKRGLTLLKTAQTMFKHIGDDSSGHTANYFITLVSGDIGIMQGQAALQQYSSRTAARANSNKIINAAIQAGIVQGTDQNLINTAAQSFIQAYNAYKQIALNMYSQQAAAPMVSVNLAGALNDIAQNLATAQALRADGDTAAQLLTPQGLLTAQQKYTAAREAYMIVDRAFSAYMSQLLPMVPFYPGKILNDQHTYVTLFNDYIGQLFIQICQPIVTTQPDLVLQYYASIASQNVDMSSAVNAIKTGVDFLSAARTAASQARVTGANAQNWAQMANVQGYESIADDAWHKALSLYDIAIQDGHYEAVNEYVSFANEYAGQYIQNVPGQYFPLIGALFIYYHVQQLLSPTPEQAALATLSGYSNSVLGQINTLITQNTTQAASLASGQNYNQALQLQQQVLTYYNTTYPGTSTHILNVSDADIQAANLKTADLESSWGATLLTQKDYANAYNNLSQAFMIYQAQGNVSEQLRQQYFLARTLMTAQQLASTVYTQGTVRVGDFNVPQNYFLQEYVQQIPDGVPLPPDNPTQNDLKSLVRSIFIAYYAADAGSSYTQIYTTGTANRISGLDQDTAALADAAEKAADAYQQKYMANADYSIQLLLQNNTLLVQEQHKQVPAIDSPYSNAPTAVGYYMTALSLYQPGTALVTVNDQTFVPGQDSDDAWDMCKTIALVFLSSSVSYQQALKKVSSQGGSTTAFGNAQNNLNELYNRYQAAQQYLSGTNYQPNFQGVSKFAADAQAMNLLIADQVAKATDIMKSFVNAKVSAADLATMMTTFDSNYSLSRQYYKTYYAATGVTNEYTIAQVVDLIVNIARLYESAGDICVANNNDFKATPFYSSTQYYYQDLVTNNASLNVQRPLDDITEKLNKAYFYGAADTAVQYFETIKKPVVNGLSYRQLMQKRADTDNIDSGVVMTSDEFTAYSNIEGLILDGIMYYMLVSDNWSKLIEQNASPALSSMAQKAINNYLTQNGLAQDQLTGNEKLQQLATQGYEKFVVNTNPSMRYSLLSGWAGQLYFALGSTYNGAYLPQVAPQDQWTQLKDRIDSRLQAVSMNY
jgi:hypothetical protein